MAENNVIINGLGAQTQETITDKVDTAVEATAESTNNDAESSKAKWPKRDYKDMDRAQLRAYAEELCVSYNDAWSVGDHNMVHDVDEWQEQVVNRYTSICSKEYYDGLLAAEQPLREACLHPEFETIRTSDKRTGDYKIPTREIATGKIRLDVRTLHKKCPERCGINPDWYYKTERINLLMILRVMEKVGDERNPEEVVSNWAMSDMAQKVRLGVEKTSKNKILDAMTEVVADMIGPEYKPLTHDVGYLECMYTKKSNKDRYAVQCAKNLDIAWYMCNICNRILTHSKWHVESPHFTKKK